MFQLPKFSWQSKSIADSNRVVTATLLSLGTYHVRTFEVGSQMMLRELALAMMADWYIDFQPWAYAYYPFDFRRFSVFFDFDIMEMNCI